MQQTTQEFLDSLDEDLSPEERAEQIQAFAIKQEADFKKQQSDSQKWVNVLAEKILEEAKNIQQDPNYLQELYKKDPKTATARVKKFWGEYTEQDLAEWKPLPPKKDDFDERMSTYERKKETEKLKTEFIWSMAFSEDEINSFDEKLTGLVGDRQLTKEQLKQAMIWIAFDMGKKFSSSKESVVLEHNAIPSSSPKGAQTSDEYKPNDPATTDLLKSMWVIKEAPKK